MSAAKQDPFPHEARVLRFAYVAVAAATILALAIAYAGDGKIASVKVPVVGLLGAAIVGGILGAIAVRQRSTLLSILAAIALAASVMPGGDARPGVMAYGLAILFGLALLLSVELVHMTERYERAHRAVEKENVPEEHINRVTDEALRTLATRAGVAALAVAGATAIAFLLSSFGPQQWRAAVETSAPLGVAVVALALAGAVSLFILARGAKFRLRRDPEPKELLPDVAE